MAIGTANGSDALLNVPGSRSNALLGYCTPKTNSLNCVPRISVCGLPTISGDLLFSIIAVKVRSHEPGMLLWSLQAQSTPFGGGTLCLGAPRRRTAVQDSGGASAATDCSGEYSFPMTSLYMQHHGLSPGTTVFAQYYSRDGGFTPPNQIGLTDALQFTVLP